MKKFTTQEFLDWCRTQPINEIYDYLDAECCPYAHFLRSKGYKDVEVSGRGWRAVRWLVIPARGDIPDSLVFKLAASPRTYGALADRAGKALEEEITLKLRKAAA